MSDEELKPEEQAEEQVTPEAQAATCAKCEEYLGGWKRALADYENLQKQSVERRVDDQRRVRSGLAEDLLPVVDNFGYVMKHMPDLPEHAAWLQGIGHIERQFTEALKNMGVEPIPAVGEKFNPLWHEAASARAEEGKEPGVVLEELVRGWKIGDVALRPSKVIVSE